LSEPEIRAEFVDRILDLTDESNSAKFAGRPEQSESLWDQAKALLDTATPAEVAFVLMAVAERKRSAKEYMRAMATDPASVADQTALEELALVGGEAPEFEGLPADTSAMLYLQGIWPWTPEQ
jgi:hypothetical protein